MVKELELMDAKTNEIVILAIVASVVNSISSSLMEGTSSNLTKKETSLVRLLAEISERNHIKRFCLKLILMKKMMKRNKYMKFQKLF